MKITKDTLTRLIKEELEAMNVEPQVTEVGDGVQNAASQLEAAISELKAFAAGQSLRGGIAKNPKQFAAMMAQNLEQVLRSLRS